MKLNVSFRFSATRTVRVGTLTEIGRDTAFEYDSSFVSSGLNPAPFRLPSVLGV